MFDVAAAYDKLRPFALSAQDRCLHDSLALVAFLASEGVFARWVIGVRARPTLTGHTGQIHLLIGIEVRLGLWSCQRGRASA
jgi:hypothetical protein